MGLGHADGCPFGQLEVSRQLATLRQPLNLATHLGLVADATVEARVSLHECSDRSQHVLVRAVHANTFLCRITLDLLRGPGMFEQAHGRSNERRLHPVTVEEQNPFVDQRCGAAHVEVTLRETTHLVLGNCVRSGSGFRGFGADKLIAPVDLRQDGATDFGLCFVDCGRRRDTVLFHRFLVRFT